MNPPFSGEPGQVVFNHDEFPNADDKRISNDKAPEDVSPS
jgi:hypothetical protein